MKTAPLDNNGIPRARRLTLWQILLRYALPLAVSVGLCVYLFTKVDVAENLRIIRLYCDYRWVALALALSVLSHVIRAARWNIQLRALDVRVPFGSLVLSIFGTYSVNLVLPRLGEVWRTGYVATRAHAKFSTVLGSMISDRLADTVMVALLTLLTFVAAVFFTSTGTRIIDILDLSGIRSTLSSPLMWVAIAAVVAVVAVICTVFREHRAVKGARRVMANVWSGFAVILKMKGKLRWVLLSLALWGCYFLQLYVTFYSFDFTRQVLHSYGLIAPMVCFVLSSISMALPSNGGYGPWQWAIILGLGLYSAGVTIPHGTTFTDMSAAFANCVMTSQTVLLILLGIITFVAISLEKKSQSEKQ